MDAITGMIIVSALGAWLCVRHRAAVPALLLGVFAVVLFCTTPLGSGLPDALGSLSHGVSNVGAEIATKGGQR